MGSLNTPTLRIELEGKRKVTDLFVREDWTLVQKAEKEVVLDVLSGVSGWVDAVVSNTGDILNKVVLEMPYLETPITQVRFVIDDGILPSYNIDLPVKGTSIMSFTDAFGATIKKIQVKTDSTDKITTVVRGYDV